MTSASTPKAPAPIDPRTPQGRDAFPHRHLLGHAGLHPWEISFLLDEAERWVERARSSAHKSTDALHGLTEEESRSIIEEFIKTLPF